MFDDWETHADELLSSSPRELELLNRRKQEEADLNIARDLFELDPAAAPEQKPHPTTTPPPAKQAQRIIPQSVIRYKQTYKERTAAVQEQQKLNSSRRKIQTVEHQERADIFGEYIEDDSDYEQYTNLEDKY